MKRTLGLLTIAMSLAAGCGDSGTSSTMPSEVKSAHGQNYGFVFKQLKLPMSSMDYAIDLVGAHRVQNQLGNIIGLLATQAMGLNPQTSVDASVMMGDIVLLANVQTADPALRTDDQVGATLFVGMKQPNPKLDGTGMFTVDPKQSPGKFYGRLNGGSFKSNSPVTTTMPVTMTLQLPLLQGSDPLILNINGAHLQFTSSTTGLMSGELHGSVRNSDIQDSIIPAVAKLLTKQIHDDPMKDSSKTISMLFDVGGCTDPAKYGGMMAKAKDGIIQYCEVANQPLIQNALAPDIQVFADDGTTYKPNPDLKNSKKDSLSLGLGFEAVVGKFAM